MNEQDVVLIINNEINRLNDLSDSLVNPLTLSVKNNVDIFILLKYISALEIVNDLVCLLNNGRMKSFPIITRSLFEEYVNISWCIKDGNNINHIVYESLLHQLQILKGRISENIKNHSENCDNKICELNKNKDILEEQLAKLRDQNYSTKFIKDKCSECGLDIQYRDQYKVLCCDSHNDLSSLENRHVLAFNSPMLSLSYEHYRSIYEYDLSIFIFFQFYSALIEAVAIKTNLYSDEMKKDLLEISSVITDVLFNKKNST